MSGKYYLVLVVLLIFGIHNSIQEVELRESDLEHLDIPAMVGEWYLIASSDSDYDSVCMSNTVEQHAEKNFTMRMNSVLKSDINQTTQNLTRKAYELIMDCLGDFENMSIYITLNISDVLTSPDPTEDLEVGNIVLFLTGDSAKLVSAFDKIVFVFSRAKVLPDRFMQDLEASEYYRQSMNPQMKLVSVHSNDCHG